MNPYRENIEKLKCKAKELELELSSINSSIARCYRECKHSWSDPVFDPIRVEGYTDPGDEPGTMGVDFRGPTYIPPVITKRWKRTCNNCGTSEYTEKVTSRVIDMPAF